MLWVAESAIAELVLVLVCYLSTASIRSLRLVVFRAVVSSRDVHVRMLLSPLFVHPIYICTYPGQLWHKEQSRTYRRLLKNAALQSGWWSSSHIYTSFTVQPNLDLQRCTAPRPTLEDFSAVSGQFLHVFRRTARATARIIVSARFCVRRMAAAPSDVVTSSTRILGPEMPLIVDAADTLSTIKV